MFEFGWLVELHKKIYSVYDLIFSYTTVEILESPFFCKWNEDSLNMVYDKKFFLN